MMDLLGLVLNLVSPLNAWSEKGAFYAHNSVMKYTFLRLLIFMIVWSYY